MAKKKQRGRPRSDNPQDKIVRVRMSEDTEKEAKEIAEEEGYTFSGWLKMLVAREIKRIKRRRNRDEK